MAMEARNLFQKGPTRRRAARSALLHAARIDRIIKGVARGDLWDEFAQLALRLTRTA
jgi:DNA polymerase-3 subunit delta